MNLSVLIACIFISAAGPNLLPSTTLPLGFELGQTKEELKLQYDVAATDHGTGRVTLVFTLKDDGRLKPIRSVDLYVPSDEKHEGGGRKSDLSLSLDLRKADDARVARVHITKELAARAELHVVTDHLDGKQEPLTWYYHSIKFKDFPAHKQGEEHDDSPPKAKVSWNSHWQTNWGPMKLELTDDGIFKGTYGSLNHSVEGTVDPDEPNVLRGRWKHTNSDLHGQFIFRLVDDGSFEGTWTYEDHDPDQHSINWTGTRSNPTE